MTAPQAHWSWGYATTPTAWAAAGCCWLLLSVLFVVGTMHLAWMAAIAVFVLAEKVAPRSLRVAHAGAGVLVTWGTWTLLIAGGLTP